MLSNVESMTRTFYLVGQGIFYRKRFAFGNSSKDVFNICMICGTMITQGDNNITV